MVAVSYKKLIIPIAIFIALLEVIPVILSSVFGINYGNTPIGLFHQDLNNKFKLSYISWLTFDVLIIYFIYITITSRLSILNKTLITIGLLIFTYVCVYPFLMVVNLIFSMILKNPPFIPQSQKYQYFPQARYLEANCKEIQAEFHRYLKDHPLDKCIHENIPGFIISTPADKSTESSEKCWRTIMLKKQGSFTEDSIHFPFLKSLLKDGMVHNAIFSILDANVNIPPHIGYYKGYLRYHLGVMIPDKTERTPFITCGGQTYHWKNCEGVLFDDMYMHYVENPTNERRVVLYLDVSRKDIPMILQPLYHLTNFYINTHLILKKLVKIQHTAKSND